MSLLNFFQDQQSRDIERVLRPWCISEGDAWADENLAAEALFSGVFARDLTITYGICFRKQLWRFCL